MSGGDGMSDAALAYSLPGMVPMDRAPTEEDIWVDSARAGNVDAFDAIMLHYEGRLLRFLYFFL